MDNNNNKIIEQFIRVYNDFDRYPKLRDVADELGMGERTVRTHAAEYKKAGVKLIDRAASARLNRPVFADGEEYGEPDEEIIKENVRFAKKAQKLQDLRRIENKSFREHVRIENSIEELASHIEEHLSELSLSHLVVNHKFKKHRYGVVHLSDLHLNECVSLPHNEYNWNIASKRLKKYVDNVKVLAKAYGISDILVAVTSDVLNSDRRRDELLSNSENRAKSCILAVDLLQQVLLDLNKDFNLAVSGVSGNESRIPEKVGWHDSVASDNYDYTILMMLRMLLESKGIQFLANCDSSEVLINFGGRNILMLHGHGAIKKDVASSVQQLKGRYSARGQKVDMVIWGHMHEALISDWFSRSSSLVGSNDFSEKALNLSGRSSQNFYILDEDGVGFHGMKIDLQDTNEISGYNIQERLEEYNSKSLMKTRTPEIIHQVVV